MNNPPLIAVVDDEAAVCRAFERLLRSAGFGVVTFASGAAFLKSLESLPIDCVVLDRHMPGLNGFDVQLEIRNRGKRIPVVFVSGHDSADARDRAMDAGAVAYLRKPADDQQLLAAIATGLSQSGS